VLRASTVNAADLMGDDSVGRVRVGNHGDFVLFEGSLEERGVEQLRTVEKRVFQGGVAV